MSYIAFLLNCTPTTKLTYVIVYPQLNVNTLLFSLSNTLSLLHIKLSTIKIHMAQYKYTCKAYLQFPALADVTQVEHNSCNMGT